MRVVRAEGDEKPGKMKRSLPVQSQRQMSIGSPVSKGGGRVCGGGEPGGFGVTAGCSISQSASVSSVQMTSKALPWLLGLTSSRVQNCVKRDHNMSINLVHAVLWWVGGIYN